MAFYVVVFKVRVSGKENRGDPIEEVDISAYFYSVRRFYPISGGKVA